MATRAGMESQALLFEVRPPAQPKQMPPAWAPVVEPVVDAEAAAPPPPPAPAAGGRGSASRARLVALPKDGAWCTSRDEEVHSAAAVAAPQADLLRAKRELAISLKEEGHGHGRTVVPRMVPPPGPPPDGAAVAPGAGSSTDPPPAVTASAPLPAAEEEDDTSTTSSAELISDTPPPAEGGAGSARSPPGPPAPAGATSETPVAAMEEVPPGPSGAVAEVPAPAPISPPAGGERQQGARSTEAALGVAARAARAVLSVLGGGSSTDAASLAAPAPGSPAYSPVVVDDPPSGSSGAAGAAPALEEPVPEAATEEVVGAVDITSPGGPGDERTSSPERRAAQRLLAQWAGRTFREPEDVPPPGGRLRSGSW